MRPNIEALERLAYIGEHLTDEEFSTRYWFATNGNKRIGCLLGHACSDEYFLARGFGLAKKARDGSLDCFGFTFNGAHDYEGAASFFGVRPDKFAWMLAFDCFRVRTETREELIRRVRSVIQDAMTPDRPDADRKPGFVEFKTGSYASAYKLACLQAYQAATVNLASLDA